MTAYLLERAWVEGAVRDDVLVEIADGRFAAVVPDQPGAGGIRLRGLSLPGFANTHSHLFHRALRGRTQQGRGTFWTWREQMYDLAVRLDPDSYHRLAVAVYAEMLAAGWTTVAEFHYLHHQPDGTPYADPNAMGHALVAAAQEAGIRLVLVDACYLSGGFGEALSPAQRRFGDRDAASWAQRAAAIDHDRVAAGIHSVRAVPAHALETVAQWARDRPLHIHVSEQVAENDGCVATYAMTPTALLAEHGALGKRTTAVHATHLSDEDVTLLAHTGTTVSLCPTTERDLGDGIGPARTLADAGVPLSLGSDSQAVIDPFAEMRAVELDQRSLARRRGCFRAGDLLTAAANHASLGVPDAGAIAPGHRADLVTIATDSVRTAGTGADEHTAVFAASAADVRHVLVEGQVRFEGDHAGVGRALAWAIEEAWR